MHWDGPGEIKPKLAPHCLGAPITTQASTPSPSKHVYKANTRHRVVLSVTATQAWHRVSTQWLPAVTIKPLGFGLGACSNLTPQMAFMRTRECSALGRGMESSMRHGHQLTGLGSSLAEATSGLMA